MKNSIYLVGALLLLNSCQEKKSEPLLSSSSYLSNDTDTLKYTLKEEKYIYPMQKSMTDTTYVRFSYPVYAGNRGDVDRFLNDEVSKLLENKMMNSVDTTRAPKKKIVEDFFKEYADYLKEQPDYTMSYGLENTIQPMHRWKSIVSLVSIGYVFTGGAHPSHAMIYHNYDIDKKQKLVNRTIIHLEDKNLLSEGERLFRVQNEIPKDSSLLSLGFFWEPFETHPEGEFYLNDNFAFERDSVVWLFNSYEIGCYAMGNPMVRLPKRVVQNYIRK